MLEIMSGWTQYELRDIQDCEHLTGTKFDGFYFIYTVTDSIHSNDSGFAKQAAPT